MDKILSDSSKEQEDAERIKNFTLMDDAMMRVAFRDDIPFTEFVLRIIMDKSDLKVLNVVTQYDMKRLLGRSITLDVIATDSNGVIYNIEIQNDNRGAGSKRTRYHSAAIDVQLLDVEDECDKLPETYVIFFCKHDIVGNGEAVTCFDRMDTKNHIPLNDGTHIIYVNGERSGKDTDIEKLIHDFSCKNAEDMYFENISDKVSKCKGKEGAESMDKVIKDIREEEREQNALKFALKMLKSGQVGIDFISNMSGLSEDDVKELAANYNIPITA